jgi:Uma2 family endonuclease
MMLQQSTSATLEAPRLSMSYEEFLAWAGEDTRAEWVDGEVIILEMPNTIHQDIILFLATLMSHHARLLDLGKVMIAPYNMHMVFVRSSRQPDLIFIGRVHLDRITADRLEGPADLAVEVISPDSVTRDKRDKLLEYQQAGIPEYWVVDPRERHRAVEPYLLSDRGVYEPISPDADGRLNSTVMPGFWLDPSWLWQGPLPDPDATIMEIAPNTYLDRIKALHGARQSSQR